MKNDMVWMFAEKDRFERDIHLSNERWNHIQKHPRMSGQIEKIKETIRNPLIIQKFEYDKEVRFYFKYYKENNEYLFCLS